MKNSLTLVVLSFFLLSLKHVDSIKIKGKSPLNPVFSVKITSKNQLNEFKKTNCQNAKSVLQVFVTNGEKIGEIPIIGEYALQGRNLLFLPCCQFSENQKYTICFYQENDTIKQIYQTSAKITRSMIEPKVNAVYPKNDTIPANILHMSITFSEPMEQNHNALNYIKLYNEKGEEVKEVWYHDCYWEHDTILTFMFHPGRVKTGIANFAQYPPIFNVGEHYSLKILPGLHSSQLQATTDVVVKNFVVGSPDLICPKILLNEFQAPSLKTYSPVALKFSEGMNFFSLTKDIKVIDSESHEEVAGQILIRNNEKEWIFIPTKKWKNKSYTLLFDFNLVDYANNYQYRLFEVKNINEYSPKDLLVKKDFRPQRK